MLEPHRLDEFTHIIGAMDRFSLIERMMHFRGRFPLDFTEDFLRRQTEDRLRHIFLALCLQHGDLPEAMMEMAAA
jgi:hypothetical protein